jgi:hypothetical protein
MLDTDYQPTDSLSPMSNRLCRQPWLERSERSDRLSARDLAQDACIRFWLATKRRGEELDSDDLLHAIDEEPGLAVIALRRARYDALRHELGRGTARRQLTISLDQSYGDTTPLDPPDAGQTATLHRVENDAFSELQRLWIEGTQSVAPADAQAAIDTMRTAQTLKECGIRRLPDSLRQRLCRLRKRTGLALDAALL